MNKKYFLFPIAGVISLSLVGCGNNGESANQKRNSVTTQPLGYYSNEKHDNGNDHLFDDNDGPIIDMMDNSFGEKRNRDQNQKSQVLKVKNESGNKINSARPLAQDNQNLLRDNLISTNPTSPANNNGRLNGNQTKVRNTNDTVYEVALADKLDGVVASVPNVQAVHSVIYKKQVLVAVDIADASKLAETKQQVSRTIQPYVKGRSISVITDEGTFTRMSEIDANIRGGELRDGIDMNLRNILDTNTNRTR